MWWCFWNFDRLVSSRINWFHHVSISVNYKTMITLSLPFYPPPPTPSHVTKSRWGLGWLDIHPTFTATLLLVLHSSRYYMQPLYIWCADALGRNCKCSELKSFGICRHHNYYYEKSYQVSYGQLLSRGIEPTSVYQNNQSDELGVMLLSTALWGGLNMYQQFNLSDNEPHTNIGQDRC